MKTGFTSLDPEIRKLLDGKDSAIASLRQQLAEVTRERDRLREACEAAKARALLRGDMWEILETALSPPERTHP